MKEEINRLSKAILNAELGNLCGEISSACEILLDSKQSRNEFDILFDLFILTNAAIANLDIRLHEIEEVMANERRN